MAVALTMTGIHTMTAAATDGPGHRKQNLSQNSFFRDRIKQKSTQRGAFFMEQRRKPLSVPPYTFQV
jgi:hypothetical protein